MSRLYLEGMEFASIDKLEKLSFENGKIPDYITSINCPLSASVVQNETDFEFVGRGIYVM